MALNRRQEKLYTHLFSLYMPNGIRRGRDLEAQEITYPADPSYTGVRGYLFPTPEVDLPAVEGRTKQVNIFTLDKVHFDVAQNVGDTWLVRLDTPGHPDRGKFWVVQGNPQPFQSQGRRDTNFLECLVKRSPKPNGVS